MKSDDEVTQKKSIERADKIIADLERKKKDDADREHSLARTGDTAFLL